MNLILVYTITQGERPTFGPVRLKRTKAERL